MVAFSDLVQIQTHSGNTVTVGDTTITPLSQRLVVRLLTGRLVWDRPSVVLIERAGEVQRIPIVDVTRIATLGFWGMCFSLLIVQWFITGRNGRSKTHD